MQERVPHCPLTAFTPKFPTEGRTCQQFSYFPGYPKTEALKTDLENNNFLTRGEKT